MTLNYNYPTLNVGLRDDDENADSVREGGMKIADTQELIFQNLRILDERVVLTLSEIIAGFDISEEVEYPYFGGTNSDGAWLIRNQGASGDQLTYANVGNNPTRVSLADAWANRLTLTYDVLNDLMF